MLYNSRRGGKYFAKEDFVWLHIPREKSKKLYNPWDGPFKVFKVLSDLVYRKEYNLEPQRECNDSLVHFDWLKPYKGSNFGTPPATLSTPLMDPPIMSSAPQSRYTPTRTLQSRIVPQTSVTIDDQDEEYYISTEPQLNPPSVQLRRSARVTRSTNHYGNLVSH